MNKRMLLCSVIACCAIQVPAQQVDLMGAVVNSFHTPLAGVVVTLGVLQDTTDSQGEFALAGSLSGVVDRFSSSRSTQVRFRNNRLTFPVQSRAPVSVELVSLTGRTISRQSLGILSPGDYSYTFEPSVWRTSQVVIVNLTMDRTVVRMRVVQSGRVSSMAASNVPGMAKGLAVTAVNNLTLSRSGYQLTNVPINSYSAGLGELMMPIDSIPLSSYGKALKDLIPVYVKSAGSLKRSFSQPDSFVNFDSLLTWEVFRDGFGRDPGVVERVMGGSGLPFSTAMMDMLIGKVKANVNATNEVIDPALTLNEVTGTGKTEYGLSYLLDFGEGQENVTDMALARGDFPSDGIATMRRMKVAYTINDSIQKVAANIGLFLEMPSYQEQLTMNLFVWGFKRMGVDTTFEFYCEEFETHQDGNYFSSITEARTISGGDFQYHRANSQNLSYNRTYDRKCWSIISSGNKDSTFAIRRVTMLYDTAAVESAVATTDQYFEVDAQFNVLGEGVNPPDGDDSYLPERYRPWMLRQDMLKPDRLPYPQVYQVSAQ
jgi:hypothetical protein